MTEGVRNATVTSKSQSDSSIEILDAGERHGFAIYNDSTAVLYLLLGDGTASATNYTLQVAASGYYEGPWSWDGAVQGIWAAAGAGAARVTEMHA